MATTDEIMGYVLNSPHNTNPNVLKDMLDEHGGGGGGGAVDVPVITLYLSYGTHTSFEEGSDVETVKDLCTLLTQYAEEKGRINTACAVIKAIYLENSEENISYISYNARSLSEPILPLYGYYAPELKFYLWGSSSEEPYYKITEED